MTLFDGKPLVVPKKEKGKVILSASRMTDMPAFYPEQVLEEVNKRVAKGQGIHTLVLWTKHPYSLLKEPLKSFLVNLKSNGTQLYIQLTITGLGNLKIGITADDKPLILEPRAPNFRASLKVLPELIELVGRPERIRVRIDPIVRVEDSRGKVFSNLKLLPIIVEEAGKLHVKHFSFSFLEKQIHRKVDRRFQEIGCTILPPDNEERKKTGSWLKEIESKYEVSISACCVRGFPESKCIDGELLGLLHDHEEPVDLAQPRKRKMCGCTFSIDIGGWPPKKCFTGCDYCYAHANYSK